ncbi:hypothetical protein M011DRAFT_454774 [Sporormia fimetaria CBS 119925]|uniref:Concanavalin A-like lectin/glucanase n=1 Tax=Sporormia fimetaria CBS 119925 TaxID=1340428 RepID=A0A6A6VNZ5_9PLEO|nr:hypothetical protein M011DRAFT_454774 [Sporormia fimetaria CBS 119925]
MFVKSTLLAVAAIVLLTTPMAAAQNNPKYPSGWPPTDAKKSVTDCAGKHWLASYSGTLTEGSGLTEFCAMSGTTEASTKRNFITHLSTRHRNGRIAAIDVWFSDTKTYMSLGEGKAGDKVDQFTLFGGPSAKSFNIWLLGVRSHVNADNYIDELAFHVTTNNDGEYGVGFLCVTGKKLCTDPKIKTPKLDDPTFKLVGLSGQFDGDGLRYLKFHLDVADDSHIPKVDRRSISMPFEALWAWFTRHNKWGNRDLPDFAILSLTTLMVAAQENPDYTNVGQGWSVKEATKSMTDCAGTGFFNFYDGTPAGPQDSDLTEACGVAKKPVAFLKLPQNIMFVKNALLAVAASLFITTTIAVELPEGRPVERRITTRNPSGVNTIDGCFSIKELEFVIYKEAYAREAGNLAQRPGTEFCAFVGSTNPAQPTFLTHLAVWGPPGKPGITALEVYFSDGTTRMDVGQANEGDTVTPFVLYNKNVYDYNTWFLDMRALVTESPKTIEELGFIMVNAENSTHYLQWYYDEVDPKAHERRVSAHLEAANPGR